MAQDKKLVEAITSMEEDFAQWYTDVVRKAELIDYTSVKGCMVIKPAGYAIWENIRNELDRRFKEEGSCGRLCSRGSLGDKGRTGRSPGASLRAPNL